MWTGRLYRGDIVVVVIDAPRLFAPDKVIRKHHCSWAPRAGSGLSHRDVTLSGLLWVMTLESSRLCHLTFWAYNQEAL